jgi:hypothetical protein
MYIEKLKGLQFRTWLETGSRNYLLYRATGCILQSYKRITFKNKTPRTCGNFFDTLAKWGSLIELMQVKDSLKTNHTYKRNITNLHQKSAYTSNV